MARTRGGAGRRPGSGTGALLEEALPYELAAWATDKEAARREAKVRQQAVVAAPPGGEALDFDVMFPELLVHRDVAVPHKLDVPRLHAPLPNTTQEAALSS